MVKTAAGVFDAAATSIALRRSDGGLDYQAAWGAGADEVVGMRLRPGQGIAGRVLATGVGEVIQDCRNDPDFAAAVARGTGYVPYTMIVVPLVPDDVSVGVLTVLDKRDGSFVRRQRPGAGGDVRRLGVGGDRRGAGGAGGADYRDRSRGLSQLLH